MAVLGEQLKQNIGDNIDHDLITLHGESGFHAMRKITVTIPENANQIEAYVNKKVAENDNRK